MKIINVEHGMKRMLGTFVHEDKVIDIQECYALFLNDIVGDPRAREMAAERLPYDFAQILEGGDKYLRAFNAGVAFGTKIFNEGLVDLPYDVSTLVPKLPLTPRALVCLESNFKDYFDETNRTRPDQAGFFLKLPHTVIGPGEAFWVDPRFIKKLDYGVQLGVVIGKGGRNIPPEKALDHVFGYTIINNLSARDHEILPWGEGGKEFHVRYGQGRNFDKSVALGPWILTKAEMDHPEDLGMRTWVNGELRQEDNTKNFLWSIPETIHYVSRIMSLKPGFVIAMGTPGGCGLGSDEALGANTHERSGEAKQGGYLQVGDDIRCEIEVIGVLENRVRRPLRDSPFNFSFKAFPGRGEAVSYTESSPTDIFKWGDKEAKGWQKQGRRK